MCYELHGLHLTNGSITKQQREGKLIMSEKENKVDERKHITIIPNPADVVSRKGGKSGIGFDNIGSCMFRALVVMCKVLSIFKTTK